MIKTSCRGCVFAVYNNEIQVDCKLGRVDKFKKQNLAQFVDGNYEISQYCNTFRKNDWFHIGDGINQVLEEVRIPIDILIRCNESNEDESLRKLKETLSIDLSKYSTVHIVTKTKPNKLIEYLDSRNIKYILSRKLIDDNDYRKFISSSKAFFVAVIDNGNILPEDLVDDINYRINNDLERFTLVTGSNYCVIQVLAYRLIGVDHEDPIQVIKDLLSKKNENIDK